MDWLIRLLWRFQFRGKMRLFTRFIPRSGERVANVFGTRASLDLGDLIQRLVYLGCYEPEETEVVSSYLRPGMTFVDGGANVGYFTCLAASLVGPTGRLVAIEPDPVLFNRLERTIRENQTRECVLRSGGARPFAWRNLPVYSTGRAGQPRSRGWEDSRLGASAGPSAHAR